MKKMIKSIARAIWKASLPFRRPLSRKFHAVLGNHRNAVVAEIDQRLASSFQSTFQRLDALEARSQGVELFLRDRLSAIEAHSRDAGSITVELNLVLDGMVRELTRMQNQMEMLHHKIDEQSAEATLLRYSADDGEPCVPYVAGATDRPLAVGSENQWSRKSG